MNSRIVSGAGREKTTQRDSTKTLRMPPLHSIKSRFMRLKFGFNVYEKPVEEYFAYTVEHDIRHLEIDLIKDHSIIQSFTSKRIARLREFSQDANIDLSFHAPYTLNLAERIPFIRKSNITLINKCLSLAHMTNATHLTCHLGTFHGLVSWPWLRKQMLDTVVQSINAIAENCRQWNIPLALENATSPKEGSEIYFLGDCVKDFEIIFDEIQSEWIGFCLDIGHANTTEGALAYIDRFGSKLLNVHYHDNTGVHDEHLNIGKGSVPWTKIMQALKDLAYDGPYVSECFQMAPHHAAQKFLQYYSQT